MSKMTNKKYLCGCICNFDTLSDYGHNNSHIHRLKWLLVYLISMWSSVDPSKYKQSLTKEISLWTHITCKLCKKKTCIQICWLGKMILFEKLKCQYYTAYNSDWYLRFECLFVILFT